MEHPKVITRGRRPAEQDFRIPPDQLRAQGYEIADAGRGGRLTYHGPGQLVGYFILSLSGRRLSIPQFVRRVEQTVIGTLEAFGVKAETREACPGVWIEGRKIASVGFAVTRGVTMHGVAINVNPDLNDFGVIVPCGIADCEMTSMAKEGRRVPAIGEVERKFQDMVKREFD